MKVFILITILFAAVSVKAQISIGSTQVDTTTIVSGIDVPWEILWGPDNHIWMTERIGRISRINPISGTKQVLYTIPDCYQEGESGLLGMALHPDFSSNPYVFAVYTYISGTVIVEKAVKLFYNGSSLINPIIILDNISGNNMHIGSRIVFLADNTLLIATGDANNTSYPQDLNSLSDKILRINSDGTIPSNNPFSNNQVWSYGHRNIQGLFFNSNGMVYSAEHGPQTDDEINIIEKGRNYGWPDVSGYCDSPSEIAYCDQNNVVEPIYNWTPTIAPSGITLYNTNSIPEFENCILVAVLKDKMITAVKLSSDGTQALNSTDYLVNMFGRIRDICVSPEGDIYIATNGPSWSNTEPDTHRIIKLENSMKTKIPNETIPNSLSVYFNSALKTISVKFPENITTATYYITDISGKTNQNGNINVRESSIPINMTASGIYYFTITTPQATKTHKIFYNIQ